MNTSCKRLWIGCLLAATTLSARGGWLAFDGLNDYVSVPDAPALDLTTNLTVETWVRFRQISRTTDGYDWQCLFSKSAFNGSYGLMLVTDGPTKTLRFYHPGVNPGFLDLAWNDVTTNQWFHVAVTLGSGQSHIYIDGQPRATNTVATGTLIPNTAPLFLGLSSAGPYPLDGDLDECRVWNVTRTQAELAAAMDQPIAGTEPGLVACYRFDDGMDLLAHDGTTNRLGGTLVNGPRWVLAQAAVPDAPFVFSGPASPVNGAEADLHALVTGAATNLTGLFDRGADSPGLSFDGGSQYLFVPAYGTNLPTAEVTVEFWQKVDAVRNQLTFMLNPDAGGNRFLAHVPFGDGIVYWDFGNPSTSGRLAYVPPASVVGTWQHFALVASQSGNYMRVYRNGVLEAQRTGMTPRTAGAGDLLIGGAAGGRFKGQMDELRIWRVARTESEIQADLGRTLTGTETNLVSCWSMDEGTGTVVQDRGPAGRNGLLMSNPNFTMWTPANRPGSGEGTVAATVTDAGAVLHLDGVDDYASLPRGEYFNTNFTVEAWVYPQSFGTWSRVIDFGNGQSKDNVLLAFTQGTSGYPYAEIWRDNIRAGGVLATQPLPLNRWSHLAVTLKNNTLTLLVDGAIAAVSTSQPPLSVQRTNNFIGRSNWADAYAQALIDEVRIWSIARTPTDILESMDAPVNGDAPGLRACWRLDDLTGADVTDSSTNAQHGSLMNGAVPVQVSRVQATFPDLPKALSQHSLARVSNGDGLAAAGDSQAFTPINPAGGTALLLDGVDDFARVGTNVIPSNGSFTVEAWAYLPALPLPFTAREILSQGSAGNAFYLGYEPNARTIRAGDGWPSTGVPFPIDQWVHLALVRTATKVTLYTNSVLAASLNTTTYPSPAPVGFFDIGRQYGGYTEFWPGQIDEIRVWNVARDPDEITLNFNRRLNGDESGLVALYRFDEGAGSVVYDASPSLNHGRLLAGTTRTDSGAPIALPLPQSATASGVAEGRATLSGTVLTGGDPAVSWFEWGTNVVLAPSQDQARFYYYVGGALSSVGGVSWDNRNANLADQPGTLAYLNPTWSGWPEDYFGVRHHATLYIPRDGTYTFFLASDDGSQLYLDARLVVNNDGLHGTQWASGAVTLNAGPHYLEVFAFENNGAAQLAVDYSGPGIPRQTLPVQMFQRPLPVLHARTAPQQTDTASHSLTHQLENLSPGTHSYRLVTANARGTNYGPVQSFEVLPPVGQTALSFDGFSDVLATPNLRSAFNNESMTIEVWFNANAPGVIVDERAPLTQLSWAATCIEVAGVATNANMGEVKIRIWDLARGVGLSLGKVQFGSWNHVVLRYDKAALRLDGLLNGTPSSQSLPGDRYAPWEHGHTEVYYAFGMGDPYSNLGTSAHFNGMMDEIRIWNFARPTEAVQATMDRPLTGNETGLVAYYRLDEASGFVAQDSSPQNNRATLYTAPWVLATVGNGPSWVPSTALKSLPLAETLAALPVQAKRATLHGLVNPAGLGTSARFEWGTTTNYGNLTPSLAVGAGIGRVPFEASLSGLEPGVTYHFRLWAGNSAGESRGEDQSFTTLVVGVGWPVATKISQGGVGSDPRHVLDAAGNVYLAGLFSGVGSFGSTSLQSAGPDEHLAFVAKLGAKGDWLWATNIHAAPDGQARIETLAVDAATNVFVAGTCSGETMFGAHTVSVPDGQTNLFVARLDAAGHWLWAIDAGGAGLNAANALTIGSNQEVFLAGHFSGTISTFGTTNTTSGTTSITAAGGTDLLVACLDTEGHWLWVRSAGSTNLTDSALGLAVDPNNHVFVTGQFGGRSVLGLDSSGANDLFVARYDANGALHSARQAGGTGPDQGAAIAVDAAGRVYLIGQFAGAAAYDGAPLPVAPTGGFCVMRLRAALGLDRCVPGPQAEVSSLALDPSGLLYVSGTYQNTVQFDDISLSGAGAQDVFVAQLPLEMPGSSSRWNWAKSLGDLGTEQSGSITVDASGDVLVSGSFQNTLELGYVSTSVLEIQDIFIARLSAQGHYRHNTWIVGQPLPVPDEAKNPDGLPLGKPTWVILEKDQPDATELNAVVWSEGDQALFPVRPVTLVVKWPTTTELTNVTKTISAVGQCVWPSQPQIHVAGAPVDLNPSSPGFRFKYLNQPFTTSQGATVDSSTSQFSATHPGYTVLQFLKTEGNSLDPLTQPSVFEVVRTLAWNDSTLLEEQPAIVGTEITRSGHTDPTGKNGFVMFPGALYDGAGPDRAYDRTTRQGAILPVNRIRPVVADELVVVWYHTNRNTGLAWADEPIRYQVEWPANPDRIVIASQQGFGPLDEAVYPGAAVYHQPDPAQPGYNPNEEHALLLGDTLYALRDDLNAIVGASEPYVLLKYRDPFTGRWAMRVVAVQAEDDLHTFQYTGIAGELIVPPRPLNYLTLCAESAGVTGPFFEDYQGRLYARAAGPGQTGTNVVLRWFYPLQPDFYYQLAQSGTNDVPVGTPLPWLDRRPGGTAGVPVNVTYHVTWPATRTLQIGSSLFNARDQMPAIRNFASAAIVYDQANPFDTNAVNSLVRLYDPLSERTLQLRVAGKTNYVVGPGYDRFTVGPTFDFVGNLPTAKPGARIVFTDLPYSIRSRLSYDPLSRNLFFGGLANEDADYGGPDNPLLLVNVMSTAERDRIKQLDGNQPASAQSPFDDIIDALFHLTRNPNRLDVDRDGRPDQAWLVGLQYGYVTNRVGATVTVQTNVIHETLGDLDKILTAAPGTGQGYVTISENNDPNLAGRPVTLRVLRVDGGPHRGDLKVLFPDNVFDERLTLRHSADFGGAPEPLEFEWYSQSASDPSVSTNLPAVVDGTLRLNGWQLFSRGRGMNDITIGDGGNSSLLTLSDSFFICRYRGYVIDGQTNWSQWVGVANTDQGQLAPGWIARVIRGLNPFETRTTNFHQAPTATYASMIQQAGARYEGDIAFNPGADNLNNIGLISAYETVLRRGRRLSIDGAEPVNDSAVNSALLLAAGRIAEFYLLLGNEAYADAADPTIGFRTDQAGYGTLAPSIFTFQNQLDSLLEEELALLRGRDNRSATVSSGPFYNRLPWNFTKNDGEVAYSQTYNISDQNGDGRVNAEDARRMYPQGHGDAWGHYLSATKTYTALLRSPHYTWEPRADTILLAGIPVDVDYQDERKFALAASAKARTGAEIVDLTYRLHYVDDPSGQYQGYKDTDADRAWGLSEWARRSGQAAFFDWALANAILPAVDPNPEHAGIQKIDRTTVLELSEIVAAYHTVQDQLDKADAGLNPLGLAKNVVPFDLDPTLVSAGKTHFEQIYDRALVAMNNTVTVFNHANQLSQSLRALQDTVDDFAATAGQQERDFKNRMIEVFGYPYAGDIGPSGTYPSGYDGPDLYHYMYVNTVELNGDTAPPSQTFTAFYSQIQSVDHSRPNGKPFFFPEDAPADPGDRFTNSVLQVSYPFTPSDFGFVAPAGWGQRQAPGEIQMALSDMVQGHARVQRAQLLYDNLLARIQDHIDLLEARYNVAQETVRIRDTESTEVYALRAVIKIANITKRVFNNAKEKIRKSAEILIEGFPKIVGLANDVFSTQRSIVQGVAFSGTTGMTAGSLTAEAVAEGATVAKEQLEKQAKLKIEAEHFSYEIQQQFKVLEDLLRQEAVLRVEAFQLAQALEQATGRYHSAVAKGLRLTEERAAFRARMAADTQENRYRDMTFRIFRNDAIQKYRAQFDLAARYVFLAATAYDFETQLLGGDSGAGREFLTDIIRQRSLGQMESGVPLAGRHGLADPLARLGMNFAVLKGQMGFNNPQTETGRFSLRRELFRLSTNSPADWQRELKKCAVPNLWDVPEFRRYCRPFAPESAGPQPGLVIRFPTTVTFGLNYFGWPLGGGDSAYDPSLFATKVRSVGVWFANYHGSGLSVTPRVYLVPAGADVLRSPSGNDLQTREWRVVDQKIPVPFPIGYSGMKNPAWIPANDSLSDTLAEIRRFSSFRAYHDNGFFTDSEVIADSRLIGRSVWNTEWLLIIPGGTFLYDPDVGLESFIATVGDIKIFFQTYAYSGN